MGDRSEGQRCLRTYIRDFLLFVALGMALVGGVNALIDPYEVFGTPRWSGFNKYKHGTRENSRIAKVYMVERVQPRTVIIGSSRTEMALDPSDPSLAQPAFNLSVEGASVYEQWRLLQHALAVAPVQELIVGVDFFAFSAKSNVGKGFAEDRLATQADGNPTKNRRSDLVEALFSSSSLNLSFKTFTENFRKPGYAINALGFREIWDGNRDILRRGGYRVAFRRNEGINAGGTYGSPEHPLGLANPDTPLPAINYFRNILRLVQTTNIRLRLVIYPKHVRQQELIRALGLWSYYQNWKAELVKIVEEQGGRDQIELWDFSTLSTANMEEVPAFGDSQTQMRYYREGSHCTKALGDLMLQRMAETGHANLPPFFGVKLRSSILPAELERQTDALKSWGKIHPIDIAEIAETIKSHGYKVY